jgi:hypothetical protein
MLCSPRTVTEGTKNNNQRMSVSGAMWPLKHSLAFEASTDPVDTSAQATLALHQTTELKESADTTFMAM